MAKSFELPKLAVWDAYLAVKANKGAAGIDGHNGNGFNTEFDFIRPCFSKGQGKEGFIFDNALHADICAEVAVC